ncbi:MAG TPA: hypothetical protein VFP31_05225 [Gaiellaceae bacterium]|nr:hypothetical protein [Gaiellaceae bacterium]
MKTRPLLCELHAHTTWSDGSLGVRELVDLYGRNGFDVLAVTDHVIRTEDPFALGQHLHVHASNFNRYLDELAKEAARARERYDLLVVPGLELTFNAYDPRRAGHAVAVGLREFVHVDGGLEHALRAARDAGAALIAAHPALPDRLDTRRTCLFASEPSTRTLVDRFELFNRNALYGWVAEAGLPGIATGDFHRPEHLATWKTLLPCPKDEHAVVEYLRSSAPAFLAPLATQERVAA